MDGADDRRGQVGEGRDVTPDDLRVVGSDVHTVRDDIHKQLDDLQTARDDIDQKRHDLQTVLDDLQKRREELEKKRDDLDKKEGEALGRVVERHPLVDLLGRVIREQSAEQVGLAASGAAFWIVITAFPTALAAVSVFGLVVSPQQVANDLAGLASRDPVSLGSTLTQQLHKVAAADRVGLSAGLAVSLVLALWSASAGVYNLERAIRAAYGLPPESYLRARGRAMGGAFAAVIALGVLALVSASGAVVIDYVPVAVAMVVGIPVFAAVVAGVSAALYRFAIGHRVGLRHLLPGGLLAAVGVLLVVVGFASYLRLSSHYTAVYGALAGAVIGMIGTYLAVYMVLLGAVLNVQLEQGPGVVRHQAGDSRH